MNPAKIERDRVHQLSYLPNVGPAMEKNLELIGIKSPKQLVEKDPLKLYLMLCRKSGIRHDPCVLDVFMSVTSFVNGDKAKPWWTYTVERKRCYGSV